MKNDIFTKATQSGYAIAEPREFHFSCFSEKPAVEITIDSS